MSRVHLLITFLAAGMVVVASCDDDGDNGGSGSGGHGLEDQTGQQCAVPDDCYDGVLQSDIQGEVQCLDRVEGGYCTHLCDADDDCCAVEGECEPGETQVCGPFESTGLMMCFISCEDADINGQDPAVFCTSYHRDFICRSTGGGSSNRKVCVPGGGALCTIIDDCTVDFPYCCLDAFGDHRCYTELNASGRDCLNDPL